MTLNNDIGIKAANDKLSRLKNSLSIVIPTFNERKNVKLLVDQLATVLAEIEWEVIFVDDDSPDGTAIAVAELADEGRPVRCLRRIGRRGLSSAVVEGVLAARFPIIAVMDADFQHDESILPMMFQTISSTGCDLVIGTRYAEGGSVGDLDKNRQRMSDFATRLSRLLISDEVSDPMSGFFMIHRDVFEACIYDLSQQGYKILLDILSSTPRRLNIVEVPFVFRSRREGESKIDTLILAEYTFLLIEKLSRGMIPPRFVLFAAVGGTGLIVNISALKTCGYFGLSFFYAQLCAIFLSMLFNYAANNAITYRDQRLRGFRFLVGFGLFCFVCSIGAVANIGVSDLAIHHIKSWSVAGIAGALIGAVFNFGVATKFVWGRKPRRRRLGHTIASAS